MKKIIALAFIAFYLLLTTGAYACLLHCTTGYFFAQLATVGQVNHTHSSARKSQHKDDNCKSDNCDCCYRHGTYVVKENFNPGFDFQFTIGQAAIILPVNTHFFCLPLVVTKSKNWPKATGPPFVASRRIYITNRTLLI